VVPVPRSDWNAAPARSPLVLRNPQGLVVHWNGPAMGEVTHARCPEVVRSIQRFHMGAERRWADIAYNFLICRHGTVFEGRGWGRRSAANGTNEGNSWGHAVMVMVGAGESIPAAVYVALTRLHEDHRRLFGRSLLRTHSTFKATGCPGPVLAAWVARNPNPQSIVEPPPPTTFQPPPSQEDDDLTPAQDKMLREIHAALEAGKEVTFPRRVRLSIRALGRAAGVKTAVNGKTDGTEVIT
jgi:hypothetical protein